MNAPARHTAIADTSTQGRSSTRLLGLVAITVAICAWAGFSLTTRAMAHSRLTTLQVQAIRYVVPTTLLLPRANSIWREVRAAPRAACLLIAVGGGVPFFLITAAGARLSSANHVSIVNLGATPVLIAVIRAVSMRRLPSGATMFALTLIVAGIVVLVLGTPGSGAGVLVLLASAALWTVYTLAQGRARLSPLAVIWVMSAPSAPLSLALAAPDLGRLGSVPARQLLLYVLVQGVGSGIVSAVSYNVAIRQLGPALAARIGATGPVPVLILSNVLLHQPLGRLSIVGLITVVVGIAIQPRPTESRAVT